ncbi:MAG: energy transducer TonB, partial [Gammaproteobacteria bacterium]|nr:energy transducer TonB [Gammaproteobacteria bacterium]
RTPEPKADCYPLAARRLDIQGRVLVEFTISPTGRVPRAPTVLLAEEPEGRVILQTAASNYVRGMQFKVPTNWNAVGGPHHKFRVSFVFLLRPCPDGALYEEPAPYFGADRWFKITAPPLEPPAVITP